jgi:hypothetical protein
MHPVLDGAELSRPTIEGGQMHFSGVTLDKPNFKVAFPKPDEWIDSDRVTVADPKHLKRGEGPRFVPQPEKMRHGFNGAKMVDPVLVDPDGKKYPFMPDMKNNVGDEPVHVTHGEKSYVLTPRHRLPSQTVKHVVEEKLIPFLTFEPRSLRDTKPEKASFHSLMRKIVGEERRAEDEKNLFLNLKKIVGAEGRDITREDQKNLFGKIQQMLRNLPKEQRAHMYQELRTIHDTHVAPWGYRKPWTGDFYLEPKFNRQLNSWLEKLMAATSK